MRTGWPGVSMVFVGEIARYFVSSVSVPAHSICQQMRHQDM